MRKELQKFTAIYRGVVVSNTGSKGQCKVFVPGVYPENYKDNAAALPWAEPAMGLFGGNFTNPDGTDLNREATICTTPHVGAQVFLFFENGDHNKPIFFATSSGGTGWTAKHENQHIIQTDNVRIIIDEKLDDPRSIQKFDSYNKNCTENSIQNNKIKTTLDIQCQGNVHIRVWGSINMQVNGDMYKEINGNVHETINGNIYREIKGNIEEDIHGNVRKYHGGKLSTTRIGDDIYNRMGKLSFTNSGDETYSKIGNITTTINGNVTTTINGENIKTVNVGSYTLDVTKGSRTVNIFSMDKLKVLGDTTYEYAGKYYLACTNEHLTKVGLNISDMITIQILKGNYSVTVPKNINTTSSMNTNITAIGNIVAKAATINLN